MVKNPGSGAALARIAAVITLLIGGLTGAQPRATPPPVPAEPGPLDGGRYGALYRGPGFALWVPPEWTVDLDGGTPGAPRGEAGTARPPEPSRERAAGAQIRFEPFPPEAGGKATLGQFEAHIRSTLAKGVPVGSTLPLIPSFGSGVATGEEPEVLTILFNLPGPGGTPEGQTRCFIHAYPRADGRVQTVVCSHRGRAERRYSAIFQQVGASSIATWPDRGGTFRRDDLGVRVSYPPGWRQTLVLRCGNEFLGTTEEERRRSFRPVASFVTPGSAPVSPNAVPPRLDLVFMEELNGGLDDLLRKM